MTQETLPDFECIFNTMPGSFVVIQPNPPIFTVLAISDELLRQTDRERHTVVGKGIFEAYPKNPDATVATGPDSLRLSLQNVLRNKKVDQMPVVRYDVPNPSGSFDTHYWSSVTKPVLDANGDVRYLLHSTTEVTEQVKAKHQESTLSSLERKFSLLMQAPVAVCILTGPEYTMELANQEMLKALGCTTGIIGTPLFGFLPEMVESGALEMLEKVRSTGETFRATEFAAKIAVEGRQTIHYFNLVLQPYYELPGDAMPAGAIMVAHDVTEQVQTRKEAEETKAQLDMRNALFEAQNEATPDGTLIVDETGKILLHNQRFAEIWNIPQAVLDKNDSGAALEHTLQQVLDPKQIIDTLTGVYSHDNSPVSDILYLKDGRVIERNGSPVVAEDGHCYGWGWYFRDVTERIRQEQKFRNVVEQASDIIAILKGEDLIVEVANPAVMEMWQIGPEDLHQPYEKLMPEMKDQGFIDKLQSVLHTGEPEFGYETPAVFRRKDGTLDTVYFNFSYQPYREADGSVTGVVVIASDVTEQVTTKYQLVESETRFQDLVREATVGIIVLNGEEARVEIVNDAYAKLIGRTADELHGKRLFEIIPEAEADFRPLIDKVRQSGEPLYLNNTPYFVYADGQKIEGFLNLVYQPYKHRSGETTGVMVLCHDVSAQVAAFKRLAESEARLQAVIEATPECIKIVSSDGTLQYMNPSGLAMIEGEASLLGCASVLDVVAPEHRTSWVRNHKRICNGESLNWEFDIIGLRGTRRRMESHAVPLPGSGGSSQLAVTRDITKRKESEEAMRQQNDQLVRINNDLDNFIYTASHDLKAPISNIEGLLALLLDEFATGDVQLDDTRHILGLMQGAVERFKKTIASLSDVVRLQQESSAEAVEVNLSEIIREVRLDLAPEIKTSDAQLNVDVTECHVIRFSEKNLRSVVYNLLSNALKYRSPDRQPEIRVSCENSSGFHVLTVSDNGIGINAPAEKLFTMFKRFHDHVEGTGIGLYMVKKIVDNAGGRIEVESEEGKGTTFRVYLPS